jgi:uncharacterized membrane protein
VTVAAVLRPSRLDAVLALAVAGAAISGYLTWVAFDHETEAFCSGVGDCATVQSSDYADLAGVPVALLGLGMYGALVIFVAARRWEWAPQLSEMTRAATFALALSGTLYSAYLTYVELFVIDAICPWCVASALVVTAILVLWLPDVRRVDRA